MEILREEEEEGLTDYLHDVGRQQTQHQLVSIEKVREQVERWSSTPLKNNPQLARSLFPEKFRDVWVRLFLQYIITLRSRALPRSGKYSATGQTFCKQRGRPWLHRTSRRSSL